MTRQRQRQLVFFNPAAVVTNTDKLRAAAFNIDINARPPAAIWFASCGGRT